jgi:toxin ParE1/3/4
VVKVVWTDSAIIDLNEIGEYIAKDSERYAQIKVKRLFEAIDILETNPKLGKITSEFQQENLRELIRINYRIVYLIVDHKELTFLPFIVAKD